MASTKRNFVLGRMNKSLDERLVPNGEYVDALNVRLGSTEESEIGSVENSKGVTKLTTITYEGANLSTSARCIGAYEDGARETIYWFVHDSDFSLGTTGKLDLIISLDINKNIMTYHVISIDDGDNANTTLNFNPSYLITGVNMVDDLLFFTDDYNPPRFIDINKNYAKPTSLTQDGITSEELLVIKKPPLETVGINSILNASEDTFLEDRFVCFAYRWRYSNNEYSATSQFSAPSFTPSLFSYNYSTGLNDGMLNKANSCQITYNSGGELVVGIDLLWKDMQTGNIRVIDKLDKSELGLVDNTDFTYTFDSSKIFTVLPDSEILRLYDNVPRLAKAQTVMGNRLMYGNYLEQYNLIDINGFPTKLEYTVDLISEDIGLESLSSSISNQTYTWDGSNETAPSVLNLTNLDSVELVQGSVIEFTVSYTHYSFYETLGTPTPTQQNPETTITFTYTLPQDFDSAYDLSISDDFKEKIGTNGNIQTVANCSSGTTLTDVFNCSLLQNIDSLEKYESGISGANQAIKIVSNASSPNQIGFVLPAMRYVDNPTSITQSVYEYFEVTFIDATFSSYGAPTSLHSDRSYEVGIIYMDEFGRATTALVSQTNALSVPCSASALKNSIRVTIPKEQIAPSWATKYKFCIKSDKEKYFNVYSQYFFRDQATGSDYFLLEGQNARKVEEGDLLRVKADTNGSVDKCVTTSVLEKKSQEADFLNPAPLDPDGQEMSVPAGVYAKMRASNFSTELSSDSFITHSDNDVGTKRGEPPVAWVPVDIEKNGEYVDYTIPAGTVIRLKIENLRKGKNNRLERRYYLLDIELTASRDYTNFKAWWDGDNVQSVLNGANSVREADGGSADPTNTYTSTVAYSADYDGNTGALYTGTNTAVELNELIAASSDFGLVAVGDYAVNTSASPNTYAKVTKVYYGENKLALDTDIFTTTSQDFAIYRGRPVYQQFTVDGNQLETQFFYVYDAFNVLRKYLSVKGMQGTGTTKNKKSTLDISIEVLRSNSLIVFETEPQDSLPDVWYEGSQSFDIDPLTGYHLGNEQDQTSSLPAIIDTDFFNCYAFGNGVESYQIMDAIDGKELQLGNRVFTTNAEDYQEIRRFADITYSGVYNDETNVNKLNEFNLGLLNFKPLENSYGPIYIMDGRETDILTLQEDKISYVLRGKNLLTDSTGGSVVASVPEVLGTQVARTEEYGISHNPESYVKWGYDKFFTDAKRGAVIQLRGATGSSESLSVLSEMGMRSWFRDLFIDSFNKQKLGGFDPYMNEYVLSSNNIDVPTDEKCIECGMSRVITVDADSSPFTFCVNVGELVGDVNVSYDILNVADSVKIDATYDGTTVTTGFISNSSGSPLNVSKNKVSETQVEISVESSSGVVQLELNVGCVVAQRMKIIQVCYSLNDDAGEFIHNEYRWTDGAYSSPLHSEQVELVIGSTSPTISQYKVIESLQGGAFVPADGATVSIISNKISPSDNYTFDPTVDELRYLRTNTEYLNDPADMTSLLAASSVATLTPSSGPNRYEATFTMPSTNDTYLYLIYDYRRPTQVDLCYDATNLHDACCDC